MSDRHDGCPDASRENVLETECIHLAALVTDALVTLASVLYALEVVKPYAPPQQRERARQIAGEAKGLFQRSDVRDFLTLPSVEPPTIGLGELVLGYLATTENPDAYFGPDAPDAKDTMAAALRWGVSEGHVTLELAERMQTLLERDFH